MTSIRSRATGGVAAIHYAAIIAGACIALGLGGSNIAAAAGMDVGRLRRPR